MNSKLLVINEILKNYEGKDFKKKLIKMAVGQITQQLFSYLSFLTWGPLGKITTFFITKGVIFIIDETVLGAHILYIYGDTHFDKKAVRKIIKIINKAKQEGMTDEESKRLDDKLAENLIELMRFGII